MSAANTFKVFSTIRLHTGPTLEKYTYTAALSYLRPLKCHMKSDSGETDACMKGWNFEVDHSLMKYI
ncbi:hypothetical protein E2C01_091403 [Portunus trituberculatus]|uniref:Uncharacterized protein n=1 Tax=Portunus trituberculatus TaxID=210409 RepID=A0A5B7JDV6_PORTR|nr:hypothetical protein [Portunus trituberculatus]